MGLGVGQELEGGQVELLVLAFCGIEGVPQSVVAGVHIAVDVLLALEEALDLIELFRGAYCILREEEAPSEGPEQDFVLLSCDFLLELGDTRQCLLLVEGE